YRRRNIFGELFAQAVKLQADRPFECGSDPGLIFMEHADVGQPFLKTMMPGSERDSVARLDASGVAAARVNVQIGAHSRFEKRIEEIDGLSRVIRVINASAGQKSGGGVLRSRDVHRGRPAG